MATDELPIEVEDPDSQFTTEKVYVLVIYTGGTIGMKESSDGMPTCILNTEMFPSLNFH